MCNFNDHQIIYKIYKTIKDDRPHSPDYPHMPNGYRHTDKHLQPGEHKQMDGWTDRHTDSGDLSPTRTCVPYVLLATV